MVCMEKKKKMKKKKIWDLDKAKLKGKCALVWVDLNDPLDNKCVVTNDIQIRAIVSTIKYFMEKGA